MGAATENDEPAAQRLLATARALATDGACAQVVEAFRRNGIDSILLKGPTVADWLYPHEVRGYADIDLLVDPRQVMEAAAVLTQLGFVAIDHHVSVHAHPWTRASDEVEVDLHITVWGSHRPASQLWQQLQPWQEVEQIGATQVPVLNLPARALLVVLHAAHHVDSEQPREDLRRALRTVQLNTWRQAEQLADRLWALPAMAGGLRLEPDGGRVLEHLPLARAAGTSRRWLAPFSIGRARVAGVKGIGGKASVITRLAARAPRAYLVMWRDRGRS